MRTGCHDGMKHLERELSSQNTNSPPSKEIKREARQINVVLSMPKKLKRRVNFLHVQYARKRTMQKKIVGIKENVNAITARSSTILKMSVDSKINKRGRSEIVDDENHLFYACQNANNQKDAWLIDSGCTNHMTKHSHVFTKIDPSIKIPVRMCNGEMVKSEGKGIVTVETRKGTYQINDVLYVPNLDQNLLSVPQMMQNGYSIHFEKGTCTICDPKGKNIARVKMQQKCFPIHWQYKTQEKSMQVKVNELTWLWHKRFGHCNSKSLKLLSDKNMVKGIPLISEITDVCDAC